MKRTPLGTERPVRVHRIADADGKTLGGVVRLSETWLAVLPNWSVAGETRTYDEALTYLTGDTDKPRKTSVYLDSATTARVRASGATMAALIRRGLDEEESEG